MKILYVENNPSFADVVCKCFLKNYDVTIEPTVQGAKEKIEQYCFDILLVDYDLDDGKGNENRGLRGFYWRSDALCVVESSLSSATFSQR